MKKKKSRKKTSSWKFYLEYMSTVLVLVILIIGITYMAVFAWQSNSMYNAKKEAVVQMEAMSKLGIEAERAADSVGNYPNNLCDPFGPFEPHLKKVEETGGVFVCEENSDAWRVVATLSDKSYFCADSRGFVGRASGEVKSGRDCAGAGESY